MMHTAIVTTFADKLAAFRGELVGVILERGHKLTVLGCEPEERCMPELEPMGIRYVRLPFRRSSINPLMEILFIINAARIFSRLHIDVLLVYGIRLAGGISIAARLAGIKNVYSMINGTGTLFHMRGIRGKAARFLSFPLLFLGLGLNRFIFFQNRDNLGLLVEKRLVRKGKAVIVNGSGVNLERFGQEQLPANMRFLLVGRMLRDKGVMEFIRAAETVKGLYPEAEFILIGPMEDHPAAIKAGILDSCREKGLIEHISWTEHIQDYMASCYVYVLPSYHEGTPRTVLEAMALGRPVITTDAPGCRETVIEGVNGFLVPIGDAEALAARMIWMIEHREAAEAMGKESRRICRDKYDVRDVNSMMIQTMNL